MDIVVCLVHYTMTYQLHKTINLQSEVACKLEEVRWEKSEDNNYVRVLTVVGTKELRALNLLTGKTRPKSVLTQEATRVGTLIGATIYLQFIQNRYMFRSFTVLHCSHQHCVQPVASDVEVVGYL